MNNEDFENDKKDAGEVGASHQVTVCYEINPRENAELADSFITLRVRYKNPGEEMSLLNEYEILESDIAYEMSDDQRFICAVVETCMLLHESRYAEGFTLEEIVSELDSLELTDSYKIEFRELLKACLNN